MSMIHPIFIVGKVHVYIVFPLSSLCFPKSLLSILILGLGVAQAQWVIYDCSVLPHVAEPAWYEQDATVEDGLPELASVVDDPDITGNKLIMLGDWVSNTKEM